MSEAWPLADGVERRLDPRHIQLQRQIGWIATLIIAGGTLLIVIILSVVRLSLLQFFGAAASWVAGNVALAWHLQHWPAVAHRHTSYRLDGKVFEIRRGVFWREIVSVPRSRVQHTDVSQGPLERTYGLGTLVVYTAGTDHAKVELHGLSYEAALQMREHLLVPREGGDAV